MNNNQDRSREASRRNLTIKEAYFRQHGALRGAKQYTIDEQYQFVFDAGYSARDAEVEALKSSTRYALATFRALDRYTFEDSDHGLLIAEAVKKLEAALSGGEETEDARN